jgi:hypothetical protein
MAVASSTKLSLGKGGEMRVSVTAGTSLTTTASYTQLQPNTQRVFVTPRNFADSAAIIKVAFNPYLCVLKTLDTMATEPIDYSSEAQDNSTDTSVDISSLNTVANGDFLLIGAHVPFRGVDCDVDSDNSTASVTLTVSYWKGGSWVDTENTDGWSATAFDQDGLTYWTVPANWYASTIRDMYPNCPLFKYTNERLYWTRWEVDTAIDSSVTLDAMLAANRSTTYGEIIEGQMISKNVFHGVGGCGCIEALTDTGTANLVVNCFTGGKFE